MMVAMLLPSAYGPPFASNRNWRRGAEAFLVRPRRLLLVRGKRRIVVSRALLLTRQTHHRQWADGRFYF
jgi:hypothetical protein